MKGYVTAQLPPMQNNFSTSQKFSKSFRKQPYVGVLSERQIVSY